MKADLLLPELRRICTDGFPIVDLTALNNWQACFALGERVVIERNGNRFGSPCCFVLCGTFVILRVA